MNPHFKFCYIFHPICFRQAGYRALVPPKDDGGIEKPVTFVRRKKFQARQIPTNFGFTLLQALIDGRKIPSMNF
jgi:hypothetical protein